MAVNLISNFLQGRIGNLHLYFQYEYILLRFRPGCLTSRGWFPGKDFCCTWDSEPLSSLRCWSSSWLCLL